MGLDIQNQNYTLMKYIDIPSDVNTFTSKMALLELHLTK